MSPGVQEESLLESLAPHSTALATLLGAFTAGLIAWRSISHRRMADIKAEWWRRVQYALEQCHSDDRHRVHLGVEMLTMLGQGDTQGSRLDPKPPTRWRRWRVGMRSAGWIATKDDKQFLSPLVDTVVQAIVEKGSWDEPEPERHRKRPGWTLPSRRKTV